MTTIDTYVSQENNINGRGANGIPVDYDAVRAAAAGANLGSITPPVGHNAVIGFQSASFTSGNDVVLLDGSRNNYAIQVTSNGVTAIKDIGAGDSTYGQTVTVTGESFIVFNGAHINLSDPNTVTSASNPYGVLEYPNDIYFVLNQANAQLAEFYNATLPWAPHPSLGGFEYWEGRLADGMSLTSIAQSFINTAYFQQHFGDPGTTHAQHLTFVESLYTNILGMTLDANNSGVQYWVTQMDNVATTGMDGAHTLISFTNATSNSATINVSAGTTPGVDAGWLINYSLTGGLADTGVQLSASTVLTQGNQTGYVDTSQIDISSVPKTGLVINNYAIGIAGTDGGNTNIAGAQGVGETIVASPNIPLVYGNAANDTLISAPHGGSTLSLGGQPTGINEIAILHGSSNTVLVGSMGNTVVGFQLDGTDGLQLGYICGGLTPNVVTTASVSNKFDGHTLATPYTNTNGVFQAWTGTFINVGPLADTLATTMAKAANAVYTVGDVQLEHAVFYGQVGNDTEMYFWGQLGSSSTADTNGNHQVDANEFSASVTLIGINATNISAANIHTH